jgi:hypothetical protein
MKLKRTTMLKLLGCFVIAGFVASFWMSRHAESQLDDLIAKADLCKNIDEVIAFMGRPYAVYEQSPPKLGSHLLDPTDDPLSVVFYAFTVKNMPPMFLIVKTSRLSGQVLKVGIAKS